MPAADWRFDEADDAAFDAGFDDFIKDRKLPLFKKGEWPQEVAEKSTKVIETMGNSAP